MSQGFKYTRLHYSLGNLLKKHWYITINTREYNYENLYYWDPEGETIIIYNKYGDDVAWTDIMFNYILLTHIFLYFN